MSTMASQIISFAIVYSNFYSAGDQRKDQLRVTGLCEGNSPVTGEFHAQRTSNAENVSIWWRHPELLLIVVCEVVFDWNEFEFEIGLDRTAEWT